MGREEQDITGKINPAKLGRAVNPTWLSEHLHIDAEKVGSALSQAGYQRSEDGWYEWPSDQKLPPPYSVVTGPRPVSHQGKIPRSPSADGLTLDSLGDHLADR